MVVIVVWLSFGVVINIKGNDSRNGSDSSSNNGGGGMVVAVVVAEL